MALEEGLECKTRTEYRIKKIPEKLWRIKLVAVPSKEFIQTNKKRFLFPVPVWKSCVD
jgi:hypothetical protein